MILDLVDNLILYAKHHLELTDELDQIYFRNLILEELNLSKPNEVLNTSKEDEIKNLIMPDSLIKELNSYLIDELKLSPKEAELKYVKIMGILTPRPSEVNKKFLAIYKTQGDFEALDYLYDLSIKNYYFQKTNVDKNIVWETKFPSKNLEISINLSKPEKNNKDIAKLLVKPKEGEEKYPKCLLCLENLGFKGTATHPARENIRIIPLSLGGTDWFLQYSPYGYFKKHCIVFSRNHSNMKIDRSTFRKLTDFVTMFPSFFIGSNSDLPIVGGSILSHEHFQGGEHLLPIMKAKPEFEFELKEFQNVKLYKLDWHNSCLLLTSESQDDIIEVADRILKAWRNYDDPENDIYSHTGEVPHNTITPSARKVGNTYYLYLILRNNRCDEKYPDGIFHAHPEYHHIKKEGIGIIEAMGLFILPGRLIRQENEIKACLKKKLNDDEILNEYQDLSSFLTMIHELKANYNETTIDQDINSYIENVCKNILINTATFKPNEKGNNGLRKFIGGISL